MNPRRVQHGHEPGWHAPAGAVFVGSPSKWRNAFIATGPGMTEREQAEAEVDAYAERIHNSARLRAAARRELAGRDLVCGCPLADDNGDVFPCHADVLLAVANGDDYKPTGTLGGPR